MDSAPRPGPDSPGSADPAAPASSSSDPLPPGRFGPRPLAPVREPRYATWLRIVLVAVFLYVFLVGIRGMGVSFKLMGKDFVQELLLQPRGPFLALMIGILGTTLVQSSSITTSTLVALVSTGALPIEQAVYMIMGANVGTTVTNTLVSLGHITRSEEYRRAFAAATVHDFFNLLSLAILFPLECSTQFLTKTSGWIAEFGLGEVKIFSSPVKAAVAPVLGLFKALVAGSGPALLVISLICLFGGLIGMVRTLKGLVLHKLANLFDRILFKTSGRSLVLGIGLTVLVQSSSISTSVAVPLVGAGVLNIRQVFPYTMGANIGTTFTAVLAAAATGNPVGIHLAIKHVMFNVIGVALWWFFREIPIRLAEGFARLAMRNRTIPIIYIITLFYLCPAAIIFLFSS